MGTTRVEAFEADAVDRFVVAFVTDRRRDRDEKQRSARAHIQGGQMIRRRGVDESGMSALYAQLCVPVPAEGATGPLVVEWIERVLAVRNLSWAATSDVDAAGDTRAELYTTAREVRVMPTNTLLSLLRRASQVVWASVFFCETEQQAHALLPGETYQESTAKSNLAIRVFDGCEVHVIGREDVVRGVERVLPAGSFRVTTLDDVEFPE